MQYWDKTKKIMKLLYVHMSNLYILMTLDVSDTNVYLFLIEILTFNNTWHLWCTEWFYVTKWVYEWVYKPIEMMAMYGIEHDNLLTS